MRTREEEDKGEEEEETFGEDMKGALTSRAPSVMLLTVPYLSFLPPSLPAAPSPPPPPLPLSALTGGKAGSGKENVTTEGVPGK